MHKATAMETWDSDLVVDRLLKEYDETVMPIPDIECEPHLLISKVRKHYMEYIIKLLSVNYENNQRLLNKNIYLPSAIWRCAKNIELNAAHASMVVQLYRNNIVNVIKQLKIDTKKGKLYRKLYECLHKPPENEKKTQATFNSKSIDCSCQCTCGQRKRRRKSSGSPKIFQNETVDSNISNEHGMQNKIPVLVNAQIERSQLNETPTKQIPALCPVLPIVNQTTYISPKNSVRMSIESQDSDELMLQLEKLFQGDSNDDDIFEGTLCDTVDIATNEDSNRMTQNAPETQQVNQSQKSVTDVHAAQIKSLDERLASLAGMLVNNNDNVSQQKQENPKTKKSRSNKWLCEEYFLKIRLFEMLDQIRECNRKKLARIKEMLLDLFGNDSDDEGVVSPMDETPEFVTSCKERIAPWVVKLLTPYYIKGRIRGKSLFKALAKHLIRLIYQCSRYPHEYEVNSFVTDFLENHKMIRCEADFKEFRIDNL